METQTAVMRRRVHHIGRAYRSAHRRPIGGRTPEPAEAVAPSSPRAEAPCTAETRYESPLPHAALLIGGFLLTLAAGVMLGIGAAVRLLG